MKKIIIALAVLVLTGEVAALAQSGTGSIQLGCEKRRPSASAGRPPSAARRRRA